MLPCDPDNSHAVRYRFGELTFDPAARLLLRGPEVVAIGPKAVDLLALLLKERPRALSRDELLAAIWRDAFVAESNLTALVNDIRRAIGDDAKNPVFLRTHHAFGYSFVGDVVVEEPAAPARDGGRAWLVWGRNVLLLSEGENIVGREPDAAIWVGDPSVSRRHLRIRLRDGEAVLEDLGSKNGTYVRGSRAEGPVPLNEGDLVRIGSAELTFHMASVAAPTETAG